MGHRLSDIGEADSDVAGDGDIEARFDHGTVLGDRNTLDADRTAATGERQQRRRRHVTIGVAPAKAPTRRRRHAVESKLNADFFACPQHHVIP
jgi:hypothetical protein